MPRGCCQGSSLGGLIYSLFSNDLSKSIVCNMLSYADDVILYASGNNSDVVMDEVFAQFKNVCDWCLENGITVNYSKTKYMVFFKEHDTTEKSERMFCQVNGENIERVFEFKYLGIWIDPHLNFKKHYDVVCKKVIAKLKYLRGVKRYLNVHVLKIMINAYVHSVINYGIEIWAVQTDTLLIELQNRIDRFIYEFFVHKYAKRKYRHKTDTQFIDKLRKDCNFMTILVRRDYVLLKCAYKDMIAGSCNFSLRNNVRTFPLMNVDTFSSQIYKKSVKFRTTKLWNALPRDLDVRNMSYGKFKEFLCEDMLK